MSSSSSSSDALAPPSFQHASGFHCPICLRSELAPIRQDCGHVLCLQCTHQAISMIGSCPLCRTQLFFGARNDAGPEIGHRGPQSRSERISVQ
uniref:RING-type domain-containing protein n=1 Tax=Globisporangium ultimum (strain ATCC 200006 / CBS 805.95 / DAOM BR144) TaxID=431595 RepID=K3WYQ0_GLOUD